jgi:hypothetical protein
MAQGFEQAQAPEFQFVFPENIVSTVFEAVGVDRQRVNAISPAILPIRRLLTST